jgi:hypothetical protein
MATIIIIIDTTLLFRIMRPVDMFGFRILENARRADFFGDGRATTQALHAPDRWASHAFESKQNCSSGVTHGVGKLLREC